MREVSKTPLKLGRLLEDSWRISLTTLTTLPTYKPISLFPSASLLPIFSASTNVDIKCAGRVPSLAELVARFAVNSIDDPAVSRRRRDTFEIYNSALSHCWNPIATKLGATVLPCALQRFAQRRPNILYRMCSPR